MSQTPLQDDIEAALRCGPLTTSELSQLVHSGVVNIRRALSALVSKKRVVFHDARGGSWLAHITTTGEST